VTDARFPERWLTDRQLQSVPPSAFRVFANSLMWAVGNRTDGHIPTDALPLIPHATAAEMGTLTTAGALDPDLNGDGWHIAPSYLDWQMSRDELDALAARRRADRQRKARERAGKSQAAQASRDTSRDSHAESVRTGQDRPHRQQPPTDRGATCLGCDRPARRGCSTCWDHANLETAAP
jgi:hypothetical protein